MSVRLPEPLQRLTTDPDAPLHQGVYRSALRDERLREEMNRLRARFPFRKR